MSTGSSLVTWENATASVPSDVSATARPRNSKQHPALIRLLDWLICRSLASAVRQVLHILSFASLSLCGAFLEVCCERGGFCQLANGCASNSPVIPHFRDDLSRGGLRLHSDILSACQSWFKLFGLTH